MGAPRFRPPREVVDIVVEFGPEPLAEKFLKRFGAWKLILTGTAVAPASVRGEEVVAFYNPSPDGSLAAGSNLARDIRNLLGALPPAGDQVKINDIFASKRVRARLRWSGSGVQAYAVIGEIKGEKVP
jgi:hypothetical protein